MGRHAVLGTAGHVDHGKTSLIWALSGVDCDTHKEEKRRGITINLGFTSIEEGEDSLSIVDMPGHADFIKTMVAGASGLDLFLLVIDSESGIMPQTIEHLHILQTMGICRGVVVFTKSDLVEADFIELLQEEVVDLEEQFPFLGNVPRLVVSAKSRVGLEALKRELFIQAFQGSGRKRNSLFRLYIDRLFTINGAGTIVAGSVLGGRFKGGETLYLYPGGAEVRVRRMERHGTVVTGAKAGDRVSLNILGVKKQDLKRGMQLAAQKMVGTTLVDLHLAFFTPVSLSGSYLQVIFLIGSKEVQARLFVIGELKGNAGYLVQASLGEGLFLQPGEPYIIRNSSDERSLGGGRVIDPSPLHHKKRPDKLRERMVMLLQGDMTPKILELLDYYNRPVSLRKVSGVLNLTLDEFVASLKQLDACGVVVLTVDDEPYALWRSELRRWRESVVPELMKYHEENAFNPGASPEVIGQLLGISHSSAAKVLLKRVIQELESSKKIYCQDGGWFAAGVNINAFTVKKNMKIVDDFVRQTKEKPPTLDVVVKRYPKISKSEIVQIVNVLKAKKRLYLIEERLVHISVLNRYSRLFFECLENEGAISRTDFRDFIKAGRRFASIVVSYLEEEKCIAADSEQFYHMTECGRNSRYTKNA